MKYIICPICDKLIQNVLIQKDYEITEYSCSECYETFINIYQYNTEEFATGERYLYKNTEIFVFDKSKKKWVCCDGWTIQSDNNLAPFYKKQTKED